jgi:hypothetical protein
MPTHSAPFSRAVSAALERLNKAIDGEDADACFTALSDPALAIVDVDAAGVIQYHTALKAAKDAAQHNVCRVS